MKSILKSPEHLTKSEKFNVEDCGYKIVATVLSYKNLEKLSNRHDHCDCDGSNLMLPDFGSFNLIDASSSTRFECIRSLLLTKAMRLSSTSLVSRLVGTLERGSYRRTFSRLAAAHSSWFKIPEEGMKEFELLARGSAFFVSGPTSGALIALLSAHVAAPHRYANYFPHEWLRHVKDRDCRSVLETRSKDGKDVTSTISELSLRTGFRHSALDVAAFVLGEKEEEVIEKSGIRVLKLHDVEPQAGQKVAIGGYRLIGESGSGTEAVIETELNGSVSEVVQSRVFVNTGEVDSEMGMCGGPVVLQDNENRCCGILEGLVPRIEEGEDAQEMHRRVAGHSVYIAARELQMFLHDIETEVARARNKEQSTK